MKFEIGQIVSYTTHRQAEDDMKWLFFITGVLPSKGSGGNYYRVFCFKTPKNQVHGGDLHESLQFSEVVLNVV